MNGQSVLDQIAENPQQYMRRGFRTTSPTAAAIDPSQVTSILRQFGPMFWAWFDQNLDRKIWTVKVWIINKTFTVADLRPLFVILFGQHP